MRIRLLGKPEIQAPDGSLFAVRGLQTWAVLARVLLSDRPLARREIAAELFPNTIDPLGALRWCLASLRRTLGPEALTGDPVQANLPADCGVDVWQIDAPEFDPLTAGELLEDSAPEASGAEFETWLLVERVRLATRIDARLRRDTLDALAAGDAERALTCARHAVRRQPFDEGAHVHLIRALVLSGHGDAARAHALRTEAEFRRELGLAAAPALHSAARSLPVPARQKAGSPATIHALVQAGTAALNAGASDAGIESLRRAVAEAEAAHDDILTAEALVALGTALIHAIRGQDDEGIVHLRRAEDLSMKGQDRALACKAVLELGYADALVGRRPDAARLISRAFDLSEGDPERVAKAHGFSAFNLADWGRHDRAEAAFSDAIAASRATRSATAARSEAWALGLGAWARLRAGDTPGARNWALASLDTCSRLDWLAFRPWPEAVLAEAELSLGADPETLRNSLQDTLAMSCQLGDPCWEAGTCRAIALTYEREGDPARALGWIDRAGRAFTGISDPYAGLQVQILFDRTRLTLPHDPEAGQALLRSLLIAAARLHADGVLDQALSLREAARRA